MELGLSQNPGTQKLDVMANRTAALQLAEQGFSVLPLHFSTFTGCSCKKVNCTNIAKHPSTRHGLKDASKNKVVVANWWHQNPFANIGILTGRESGLIVLDVDPRHYGDQSLVELQREFEPLPQTLSVKTGGNGWHYYFQFPKNSINQIIGNRTNMLPGLDIRGDGGYIIAPPSVHASGQTYSWVDPKMPIALLPLWLEKLITNRPLNSIPQQTTFSTSKNNFLGEGNRNNGLCSIAGYLKSKGMEGPEISTTLENINESLCKPPLKNEEVKKIAKSVARYATTKQAKNNYQDVEKPWSQINAIATNEQTLALSPSLLPNTIKNWCVDIANRKQVPLEFVAGPCLVMVASLIGRKVVVAPKKNDDWHVVPNLWGCVIAPPGSLKTPAISAVLKPLYNIAQRAQTEFTENKKRKSKEESIALTEIEALKDSFKCAIKRGDEQKINDIKLKLDNALASFEVNFKFREPRYITSDSTIEKLLTILEDNPQGLLIYRDELSGWLETIMHKNGREGDREFYLESWNGDNSYQMDRVGRGTTTVDAVCLSVLGGLQPGKFASYVSSVAKSGKSDDGLLQRFQIIMFPDRLSDWKKVDCKPDLMAQKLVEEMLQRIDKIPLPQKINNSICRPVFNYTETAQQLADEWMEKIEKRLRQGKMPSLMEAHISKFRSLMPSLALIFTLMDNPNVENMIHENEVRLAIEWCKILEDHAKKAYGEYLDPQLTAAKKFLVKIIDGLVKDGDKCRDIYRRAWRGLKTIEDFDGAISILSQHGYIRIETVVPITGGRSEIIRLHPELR